MKLMCSLLLFMATMWPAHAQQTNEQERIREEYVSACIKLQFIGDHKLCIAGLRDMMKCGPTNSAALPKAHKFLATLGSKGCADDPSEIVTELRKVMTPEQFVAFVEKTDFHWREPEAIRKLKQITDQTGGSDSTNRADAVRGTPHQ